MLTREVLRAVRQIVGAVDLAGMDVVEVSPPYDHAETTAMAANRAALEAISALAVAQGRRRDRALGAGGRVDRPPDPATASGARASLRPRPADDPGDLDLYRALADRADGPVLELAAGSGRLAVPLAAGGPRGDRRRHRPGDAATGPAIARDGRGPAERAARAGRGRPARRPAAEGRAPRRRVHRAQLAHAAAHTGGAARGAFRTLAAHLAPGGLAVGRRVAARCRRPGPLRRSAHPRVDPRPDPATGALVTKTGSALHDARDRHDRR